MKSKPYRAGRVAPDLNMETRAYVLHPDRDPDTRARARDTLNSCGLPGDLWPLVDGAALSSSDLADIVGSQLFDPDYPLSLNTAEIGHFLTYRQIWADMQRCKLEAALIFDGPAQMQPHIFDDALDLALEHLQTLGVIELRGQPNTGPAVLVDTLGAATLTVPQQAEGCATALLITHEAAAHFLALSDRIDRPVETFLHSHWHTGLRCATVAPSGLGDRPGADHIAHPSGAWPRLRYVLAQRKYLRAVACRSQNSAAPASGGMIR